MSEKVLLLNNNWQVIAFISDRKAIKLFFKGKVDVISTWPNIHIHYGSGRIDFPATLKLKYYIKKNYSQLVFSRKAVFKRDNFSCQYCSKQLKSGQATVDHIIPRSAGGLSSFNNCVTACYNCNNKKGGRTPEQAHMTLLNKPSVPSGYLYYITEQDNWHESWNIFIGNQQF